MFSRNPKITKILNTALFWGDSYLLHISPYFGESEIRFVREHAAKSVCWLCAFTGKNIQFPFRLSENEFSTYIHTVALRCVALRCVALRCVALRCVGIVPRKNNREKLNSVNVYAVTIIILSVSIKLELFICWLRVFPTLLCFGFDLTQSQSSKPISRNGYGPDWYSLLIFVQDFLI